MAIRAVLWDVDDTLLDFTGSDREAALHHFAAEGLLRRYPSPEAALGHWQAVLYEHYPRFLRGELSFDGQRRARARAFLGEELSDSAADEWFGRYLVLRDTAERLFPDVLPALAALVPRYRHGVLSNSLLARQDRRLRTAGIRERFEVLLCSDALGCAKPEPGAFHAACRALGLAPGDVAYVGDQRDTDATAASAAGLHGIWLDRGSGTGADAPAGDATAGQPHRVTGLAQLPGLLAGIAGLGGRAGPPR